MIDSVLLRAPALKAIGLTQTGSFTVLAVSTKTSVSVRDEVHHNPRSTRWVHNTCRGAFSTK